MALLLVLAPAARTATLPLTARLAQALAVPGYPKSTSAAVAVDLTTGKPLFARNADLSLAPASNEKLPVTFAALRELGASYRFRTEVLGRGRQIGATWQGDIFLKGFGDPTLTSGGINRLAAQLGALGITQISGRVLGDESWFDARRTAPGWKSGFFISESPPLSALVVDRAVYDNHVALRPALAAAGQLAPGAAPPRHRERQRRRSDGRRQARRRSPRSSRHRCRRSSRRWTVRATTSRRS